MLHKICVMDCKNLEKFKTQTKPFVGLTTRPKHGSNERAFQKFEISLRHKNVSKER